LLRRRIQAFCKTICYVALREWDVDVGRTQFFDNLPVQIALTCARQSGSEDWLTMLLSSMISSSA
jgi:hypothetical protein